MRRGEYHGTFLDYDVRLSTEELVRAVEELVFAEDDVSAATTVSGNLLSQFILELNLSPRDAERFISDFGAAVLESVKHHRRAMTPRAVH
jgi:hypothetical protein